MNSGKFTLRLSKDRYANSRILEEFYYMFGNTLNACLVDYMLKNKLNYGVGFDNAVTDCNDPIVKKLILDPEKVEITIKIPSDVLSDLAYNCGVVDADSNPSVISDRLDITYDYSEDKVIYTICPVLYGVAECDYILNTSRDNGFTFLDIKNENKFTSYNDICKYLNTHDMFPCDHKGIIANLNTIYNSLSGFKYSDHEVNYTMFHDITINGDKRTYKGMEEYIKTILIMIYNKLESNKNAIIPIGVGIDTCYLFSRREGDAPRLYILTDIERELEINIFRLEPTYQTTNKEEDKMKNRTLEMIEEEQRELAESIKKSQDELQKMYDSKHRRNAALGIETPPHIQQQPQPQMIQQPVYQQPHMMQQQYMSQQQPYGSTRGPGGNPGSHKYNGPAKPTNTTDYDGKKIGITITMNTIVELATTLANDIKDFTIEPQPLDIPIPGIRFPMYIILKHKTSGHSYVLNNDGTLASIITSTQSRYSPFYTGNNAPYPADVPVEKQLVISALDFKEILEAIEAE